MIHNCRLRTEFLFQLLLKYVLDTSLVLCLNVGCLLEFNYSAFVQTPSPQHQSPAAKCCKPFICLWVKVFVVSQKLLVVF